MFIKENELLIPYSLSLMAIIATKKHVHSVYIPTHTYTLTPTLKPHPPEMTIMFHNVDLFKKEFGELHIALLCWTLSTLVTITKWLPTTLIVIYMCETTIVC